MMRIFVAVNRVSEIGYRQTTALLIAGLVRRGCHVELADVDAFSWQGDSSGNQLWVRSCGIPPTANRDLGMDSRSLEAHCHTEPGRTLHRVNRNDLILIRTNPGRDLQRNSLHDAFLDFCRMAQIKGVRVVNNPASIRFFASKAALGILDPAFRPDMMVSHDPQVISRFVGESGVDCVIKPLVGSRGAGVIRVTADGSDPALESRLGREFEGRGMVAQHFVSSPSPGDKRIVVVGGKILEMAGQPGGIHRQPAAGDFRANIHLGGTAHPLVLDDAERQAVTSAAELLDRYGIWLAGIDLVGGKVIEFNVFSTGGLFDAIRFSGADFAQQVVNQLLDGQQENST